VQSFVYLPHFLSWTVLVGIFQIFLLPSGIVNQALHELGLQTINFLAEPGWFRPLVVMEVIWKEAGWGTIIYLAALSGVDEQLYEAALIDGASRFKRIWHITLPSIRSTIVILLILRLGNFMDTGFEQFTDDELDEPPCGRCV
jgi:putative aldouronate transport system permease protein